METLNIDAWLEPLPDEPCGSDLEYDPEFLEFTQAAAGKPETQFAPAEPPDWPITRDLAQSLLGRTRDLRVAVPWVRAQLHLEGLVALPAGLRLLHGLLERFWDDLHPRNDPDDGDAFARLSVLGSLDALDGLLGDVRQALLVNDRRLGGVRMRDVEIATEKLPPRSDDTVRTVGELKGMLGDNMDLCERIRDAQVQATAELKQLRSVMNDRFGIDQAVDVKTLRIMIESLALVLPEPDAPEVDGDQSGGDADDDGGQGDSGPAPRRGSPDVLKRIDTRQDALRALVLVCEYLERTEPTNPAQLLLRRAQRLIDKNFLQLVRDLAPDAVREVARIMGVDPESIEQDDS